MVSTSASAVGFRAAQLQATAPPKGLGRRLRRSGLFAGASLTVIAACGTPQLAFAAELYRPWLELNGQTNFEYGGPGAKLFVPLQQGEGGLLYGYADTQWQIDNGAGFDAGLGYRELFDGGELGWGAFGLVGFGSSGDETDYYRGTAGLEFFGEAFDSNITGYVTFGDEGQLAGTQAGGAPGLGEIFVEGHDIRPRPTCAAAR